MSRPVPRSYLFVPGNRPERFDKAVAAGADAVIIDLEDAVPVAEKSQARAALAAWASAERPVIVRINGADTTDFAADLDACRTGGIAGVMLPKSESVDQIAHLAQRVGRDKYVIALVETARGLHDAVTLARAPQVSRLAFGSIDFQLDLGIQGERDELLCFRSHLVLASRLAGLQAPIDGVTTALDDAERLRDDAGYARRLGFGAKLCIHPRQVAVVHECFGPSPEELAWARRVVAAAEAAKGAAVALDGKMIDRPVILKAQEILAAGAT